MKQAMALIAAFCVAFMTAARVAWSSTDYVTSGLLCIHSHEGAWNANTGNGYYGGLQMDLNFQAAYGPAFLRRWGTADHWPIWAQIQAGRNGYRARRWDPWPNTARMCGLSS